MKKNQARIVYFAPEWISSSSGVLHSTVLAEAGFLHDRGYECCYIGTDETELKAQEAQRMIQAEFGISSRIFGCHSMKYGVLSAIITARRAGGLSETLIMDYQPTHIWTDSFINMPVCRKLARRCGAKVVFDLQAIYAEEYLFKKAKKDFRYYVSSWWEKREIGKADRISGVSRRMKQYIADWTGRDDMVVIPCCYDEKIFRYNPPARKELRRLYQIKDHEVLLCYAGGLSKWQRVPDILEVCRAVSAKTSRVKFLFLCQQKDALQELAIKQGLPEAKTIIRSCMPAEVGAYLSMADVGIIMRYNVPVNNVASPIKIGEYLACGLGVVLTEGIGDYSELIRREQAGLVLDERQDIAGQIIEFIDRADWPNLRQKAVRVARQHLSWPAHSAVLEDLFKNSNALSRTQAAS